MNRVERDMWLANLECAVDDALAACGPEAVDDVLRAYSGGGDTSRMDPEDYEAAFSQLQLLAMDAD